MTPSEGLHDAEAGPVRRAGLSRTLVPADTDRGAVVAGLLLAVFSVALAGTGWLAALPGTLSDPRGMFSFLLAPAAYLAIAATSIPIFGWLADSRSRKQVALGALGMYLAGACLAGAAALAASTGVDAFTPGVFVVGRVLRGIGSAGVVTVAFVVMADLEGPAERGHLPGLVAGVWVVGSLLGPFVGGLPGVGAGLSPTVNPTLVPALSAALALVALALLLLRMPAWTPVHGAGAIPDLGPPRGMAVVGRRVVRNANLAAFFFGAVAVSVFAGLPVFLVEGRGLPMTTVRFLLVPYGVSTAFAALAVGWMVSRIGHLRDLVLITGFVLVGGCLFLSRMTTHVQVWRVGLYLLMAGVGVGSALVLLPLAVRNASPVRSVGRATSMTLFLLALGGLLGAGATGVLLGALRSPEDGALTTRAPEPYGMLAERLDAVVRSADTMAIRTLAEDADLPERVTIQLGELAASGAVFGSSAEATRVAARLADEVRAKGEADEAAAAKAVREAYREAMRCVFTTMLTATILALLFTFRIPEMGLRRTSDRRMSRTGF